MNWVPQAKELRDSLTKKQNKSIASKIDEDTDDDFYQNIFESLSKYFSSDEEAAKVLIPEETDRDGISTEVLKSYADVMKPYGLTGMLSREAVDVEVDKILGDSKLLEIPTKTFDDTEEETTDGEDTDSSTDDDTVGEAQDNQPNLDDVPTGGLGSPIREPGFSPIDEAIKYNDEFNKKLVDDLRVLEGLGGDTLTDIPTYSYGITEEKADEYNLEPSQFETMEDFAIAFSDKYVKEKKAANREVFSAVDEKHHIALMSYLWNTGVFGPRQKEALEENDMEEFISEMRDAIHTQGNSSSGLSMRRAKEANMIGENLDDWTPIHKVVVSGTRASPTFEWQTESGEIVETYTSDRSLHSGNIPNKPNQTDTLDEEIIL
jgi:GH24 family phage-related lysozyme (muramidase)